MAELARATPPEPSADDRSPDAHARLSGPVTPLWAAARTLVLHPTAPVAVLLTGALLAWLGSQWPQTHAPLSVADGLARLDLITLQELGLARLLTSLPVLLWLIAALAVAAARWRFSSPRELASQTLGLTGAVAAGAAMALAPATTPILLDLPVEFTAAGVTAAQPDAGRLAPATGTWSGRCTLAGAAANQLSCKVEALGRSWVIELAPGRPSRQDGQQWTWLASGPATGSRVFDARLPSPSGAAPAIVRLQADRPVDVASLATRMVPLASRSTGPVLLALPEKAPSHLWISGTMAPKGTRGAQVRTAPIVRLQLAPASPAPWLWWLALAAAAAAVATGVPAQGPSVTQRRKS